MRALYARDWPRFQQLGRDWPEDVRSHAKKLLERALKHRLDDQPASPAG